MQISPQTTTFICVRIIFDFVVSVRSGRWRKGDEIAVAAL